jgi:hydroxyacylglutathione hydrolase
MQTHTLFTLVANTHIVADSQGVVVIDAGMPHQAGRIVRFIRALGYAPGDVRLILVTHGHIDHAGSAVALKRLTGAPIALHPSDSALVSTPDLKIPPGRTAAIDFVGRSLRKLGFAVPLETFQPDLCLEDGQSLREFGVDCQVIHTPGHTAGSVTFAFGDGTCFVGDAILNMVRVSFPLVWEDGRAARASACKIRALNPRVVYTGHGRPFDSSQLDDFIAGWGRRNESHRLES